MKRILFVIGLMLLCISAYSQFKVATYNIRLDKRSDRENGNGWEKRAPKICDIVKYHDFALLGAQEVLQNQLDDLLAGLPGFDYVGVARDDGDKKGEYSPIIYDTSLLEVLESGTFWLSETPDTPSMGWDAACRRIVTYARFKVKGEKTKFWVFNTHFDHRGVQARANSTAMLASRVPAMVGKEPFMMMGDFNSDQNTAEYRSLCAIEGVRDSYEIAQVKHAWCGTANNFEHDIVTDSRFDHIFVSEGFNVHSYAVLTDTYRDTFDNRRITLPNFPSEIKFTKSIIRFPSDHYPVAVELEVE
jgi:endonuclease/exonuclease/phosphatase family metal-dependent hydrolase